MPEQNLQYDARHAVTVIYTAAVSKHRFVSWAGAHATDAAQVQGVSELAGATGKAGSVVTGYSYFVEAAAAIPAGSAVAPSNDGSGRAVVASGTQCGRALSAAAAAGELVVVRIRLVEGGLPPESLVSSGGGTPTDLLTGVIQRATITGAMSTAATQAAAATGTYYKARVAWNNNGASASAKLRIAVNADNDVHGLMISQSAKRRDWEMTMGDGVMLVCSVPITRLTFSADGPVTGGTHSLQVAFGN